MGTPRFHSSIVNIVAESAYRPTDEQLSQLVQTKVKAGKVDDGIGDTYFGVLVANSQDEYTKIAAIGAEGYLEAVDAANKRLLEVVKAAVITPEIEAKESDDSTTKEIKYKERQKRTGFARSSASVLRRWIRAGGDLMVLEPGTTKSTVDTTAKQEEEKAAEAAGENTPEAKVAKRLASLITALNQLDDSHKAGYVAHCIEALKAS